jgi:FkbM family methyltransferase
MKPLPFKMLTETDMEQYRHDSFWTKEPETLAWIESFSPSAIFYDVGANIGIYSLYCAAIHPVSAIFAFEPHLPNFVRLIENIDLNEFENIQSHFLALGERHQQDRFYAKSIEIGSSGGQISRPVDENNSKFIPVFEREILMLTLDFIALTTKMIPNYIKIDVDGQEERVLCGMVETLRSDALRSVLIEINAQCDADDVSTLFSKLGFTADNRFNSMKNHSRVRRQREGVNAVNIIYSRRDTA